jgi:hypothetical protein
MPVQDPGGDQDQRSRGHANAVDEVVPQRLTNNHECRRVQPEGFVNHRSGMDELWQGVNGPVRTDIEPRTSCSSGADAINYSDQNSAAEVVSWPATTIVATWSASCSARVSLADTS